MCFDRATITQRWEEGKATAEEPRSVWSRPELIVLVRGADEEAVLQACKTEYGEPIPGPYYENYYCPISPGCANCSEWRPS